MEMGKHNKKVLECPGNTAQDPGKSQKLENTTKGPGMSWNSGHFEGERVGMPFPLLKKPERMGTAFPCVLEVSEEDELM